MSVIALEVYTAEQHPNADALRLYQMGAAGYETVPIVANLDNLYAVGDTVAVALPGATLKDGTTIKAVKLRGYTSAGMALGPVKQPVGTDLSMQFCRAEVLLNAVALQKWPSIELLHNLCRRFELLGEAPQITYHAKVKLDGTNGGVQVFSDRRIAVQSRSQIITPHADNAGFAAWVSNHLDYFQGLTGEQHLTIFGEWCGQGIQKRTAIAGLDRRIFAVFALQTGGITGQIARLIVDPEQIRARLPEHPDLFVLPYQGEALMLDFGDRAQLQAQAEHLNQQVAAIEQCDPWVAETFGIQGLGEGLVFYPQGQGGDRLTYRELLFKAKGEKHQVVKTKKSVQLDPEIAESIDAFVALFVTPARLAQGVTAVGGVHTQSIGPFLKWINQDIQKESTAELAAADLTWKQVNKALTKAARDWYFQQVRLV
ncbi:MAG: RNA ligase family protein [Cyanobacteria bacterium P01_G01_bin.54]